MANSFQLFFSSIYFLYNGAATCMLVAAEWGRFAVYRKTLRVSAPKGSQRSSYFLSVPWRYGIPLIATSSVLNWLVSQSIFLVRTLMFPPTPPGSNTSSSAVTQVVSQSNRIGYSPIGIISSFGLTGIMVLGLLFLALWNVFPMGEDSIPLASTCSAAISAACHRSDGDRQAHLLPLQWGVIRGGGPAQVGHCGFSSKKVGKLREGKAYA